MWGGQMAPAGGGGGMASIYGPSSGAGGGGGGGGGNNQGGGNQGGQKHDIFVGNLAFNTTEEQLHAAFSEIGRVINVRLVTDQDTGKPRGFAFVEFSEPQVALSAIRNMNDYELNGRRLRVNFSNSSHLEALAGKLGMDLLQQTGKSGGGGGAAGSKPGGSTGTTAVADALKGLSKGEMYDVVAKLKEIADRDPDEARRVISGHPQLPEALLFLMSKLDMVKTPLPSAEAAAVGGMLQSAPPPLSRDPRAAARVDPRQQQAPPPVAVSSRIDPRQQQQPPRIDPRAQAAASRPAVAASVPPPPPPPHMQQQQQPMQPPPGAYGPSSVAHLDPSLVQQVMSLTPQQIQQLPPDKQQSILQLRQQITGSRLM